MKSLALLFLLFNIIGCSWQTPHGPPILVIAIESLGADSFYCGKPDSEFADGLGLLCADGVRFTHAYTPSTMSQAAMASVFTGMYPKDTGVRHNGSQYLSAKFQTVAEVAFQNNYKTSFFSGGPPLWRKSGLDQGFELFEDNLSVATHNLYRPVKKNIDLFLNWLQDTTDGKPFFSVLFLSDLQFPKVVTINDLGMERARSSESQLKEINESLSHLFTRMKQLGIWDGTYVFLLGLNGVGNSNQDYEVTPTNLKSENTQVVLMIKPARKSRDEGIEWAIDANVSLVDVGATLYDVLEHPEYITSEDNALDVSSLRNALSKPSVDWRKNRFLMMESAWPKWRSIGVERTAVRVDNLLFINDKKPLVFNSLTDPFESQPIPLTESSIVSQINEIVRFTDNANLAKWQNGSVPLVLKTKLYLENLSEGESSEALKIHLAHYIKNNMTDLQAQGWFARLAIQENNWSLLKKLGEEYSQKNWVFIAKKKQGQSPPVTVDPCWGWMNKKNKKFDEIQNCYDDEIKVFADWTRASSNSIKKSLEDQFVRLYYYKELDEEISINNFENSLKWDANLEAPGLPRNVQLILLLSEFKGYRQIIDQRIKHFSN